jgi:hypothetical protein
MWIISKSCGLFNVRAISRIYEDGEYTCASNIGGSSAVISHSRVLDKITEAVKRGYPFLEVE